MQSSSCREAESQRQNYGLCLPAHDGCVPEWLESEMEIGQAKAAPLR